MGFSDNENDWRVTGLGARGLGLGWEVTSYPMGSQTLENQSHNDNMANKHVYILEVGGD